MTVFLIYVFVCILACIFFFLIGEGEGSMVFLLLAIICFILFLEIPTTGVCEPIEAHMETNAGENIVVITSQCVDKNGKTYDDVEIIVLDK